MREGKLPLTLISIHSESHMNTEQSGRKRQRRTVCDKSFGRLTGKHARCSASILVLK